MTTLKKSQYRLKVYKLVESIIGRTVTPEEHKSLKEVLLEYVHAESGYVKGMEDSMQKQGERLNNFRKIVLSRLNSFIDRKDLDEKKLKEVREMIKDLARD